MRNFLSKSFIKAHMKVRNLCEEIKHDELGLSDLVVTLGLITIAVVVVAAVVAIMKNVFAANGTVANMIESTVEEAFTH